MSYTTEVLDSIANHYQIDRKTAKGLVIKAMYGGTPCDDRHPAAPHEWLQGFT